ncbi:MAG: ATPase domain, partial [Myxococcales bacterium]|nr:ATPase domain [Myxococcales bacterium]
MELLGCIGRERELSRLCSLYDGGGAARAALIVGGAGMGKTALVEALLSRLATASGASSSPRGGRTSAPVLRGRCAEGQAAYGPLRQMAADDAPLLARLDAAGGDGPWDARRGACFADVAAWLAAVNASIVVIERLDLADQATRDLCGWLTTLPSPPRLLFTSRQDEPLLGAERITLAPLDDEGVRAFLQSSSVVAWLKAASGGTPRALAERLAGLSTLSPDARLVRAAAAVYGRPAAPETLAQLAGLDGLAAARAIDTLVAGAAARRDGELLVLLGD